MKRKIAIGVTVQILVGMIVAIIHWTSMEVSAIQAIPNDRAIRIDPVPGMSQDHIRGVDISSLAKLEHLGGRFFEYGAQKDLLSILKSRGVNWVRLKVWNDPVLDDGFNDQRHLLDMARRVKEHGLKLLVNFHYSDHWADPAKQIKPAAWDDLDFVSLQQAVYEYTFDVISELKLAGATPDMVQIGNEIRTGMLWPDGKLGTPRNQYGSDFDRLAKLLQAGVRGVKKAAGDDAIPIALHLDDGGNNGLYRWWFDAIVARGVPFDMIGLSYYPYWHGTLDALRYNLNDVSMRYQKDVTIFETAYGFTFGDADGYANIFGPEQAKIGGYPVSVQGQADLVRDVFQAVVDVPEGRGLGVFYWEPAWLGLKGAGWNQGHGNAWENQAMFDFRGEALDSLYVFGAVVAPVVVGIDPVHVVMVQGEEPVLPSTVTLVYSDGERKDVSVQWDAVDSLQFERPGTVLIRGVAIDPLHGTRLETHVPISVTVEVRAG